MDTEKFTASQTDGHFGTKGFIFAFGFGSICLFLVGAYPLYQPFTLQKSLGSLHRLAQKWHEIGTKDF